MVYHCNVKKSDSPYEWVQVVAKSFDEARRKAKKLKDVKQVYEVSLIPGGVPT